jgi:hypothetical protein
MKTAQAQVDALKPLGQKAATEQAARAEATLARLTETWSKARKEHQLLTKGRWITAGPDGYWSTSDLKRAQDAERAAVRAVEAAEKRLARFEGASSRS